MARVLVLDDEQSMREMLAILLKKEGHEVTTCHSLKTGQELILAQDFDLVLSDLRLPDGSGMDFLKFVKLKRPDLQVIMVTAFATVENAVEAMRQGAYGYQLKPFKLDELRLVIGKALEKSALIRENRALKRQLSGRIGLDALIGKSEPMRQVYSLIERVAKAKTNIIVLGESGTGKELVARAIHNLSERNSEAFVAVNCGAIPDTLIESEFFGHRKGSFTGAVSDKVGLFEAANKGTLFLDEIGELPASMQVKLLRALQERLVKPVGGVENIAVDVRVIAATNRDLEAEVKAQRFREDLFYRLNVIQIRLPALRERREDISLLVDHFIAKLNAEQNKEIKSFSSEAMKILLDYAFPGNVRELENIVERALTLADGPVMAATLLPPNMSPAGAGDWQTPHFPEEGVSLEKTLDAIEYKLLAQALGRTNGVKKKAAALLGLTNRSMRYRLQKHNLAGKDDPLDEGEAPEDDSEGRVKN